LIGNTATNVGEWKRAFLSIPLNKLRKIIKDPRLATALLNAQLRIGWRARVPLSVRLLGKARIAGEGEVVFGEGITLFGKIVPIELLAHKGARIMIGDNTFINYGSSITAHELVTIGRHCLLGHYTFILDNNQHGIKQRNVLPPSSPVVVEDHVWICAHVVILSGVRIGHHSVIGAGSVVTKNIPPNSVAMGNPARFVQRVDSQTSAT
jgi:acetyltransferase-like isoleucine patch superfamily enzyme